MNCMPVSIYISVQYIHLNVCVNVWLSKKGIENKG